MHRAASLHCPASPPHSPPLTSPSLNGMKSSSSSRLSLSSVINLCLSCTILFAFLFCVSLLIWHKQGNLLSFFFHHTNSLTASPFFSAYSPPSVPNQASLSLSPHSLKLYNKNNRFRALNKQPQQRRMIILLDRQGSLYTSMQSMANNTPHIEMRTHSEQLSVSFPDASVSLLDTIIEEWEQLPEYIVCLSGALNGTSEAGIVAWLEVVGLPAGARPTPTTPKSFTALPLSSSPSTAKYSYVNLSPGPSSYRCQSFSSPSASSLSAAALSLSLLNVSLSSSSFSSSVPPSFPVSVCVDVPTHFLLSRSAISLYPTEMYKLIRAKCKQQQRQTQRQTQTHDGDGLSQCDWHYFIPFLYGKTRDKHSTITERLLYHTPILQQPQKVQWMTAQQILDRDMEKSILGKETLPVGVGIPHPLYRHIAQDRVHLMVMAPSVSEQLNVSLLAESSLSWLQSMPLSAQPPSVAFHVYVQPNIIMQTRITKEATDRPLHALDSVCGGGVVVPPALAFLRYIDYHYNDLTRHTSFLSSYRQQSKNNRDRLQQLITWKWRLSSFNTPYQPFNIDDYTCEDNYHQQQQYLATKPSSADDLNATNVHAVRAAVYDTIRQTMSGLPQRLPTIQCYYRGGEFVVHYRVLLQRSHEEWKSLTARLCTIYTHQQQKHLGSSSTHPQALIAETFNTAMETLWPLLFSPLHTSVVDKHGHAIVSYHPPQHFLYAPDEYYSLDPHNMPLDQYLGRTSPFHPHEFMASTRALWLTNTTNLTDAVTGESRLQTFAIVVATFQEHVAFATDIRPDYVKVVVRQDHPAVPGQKQFGLGAEHIENSRRFEATIPNTMSITSRGLCKEGSSYLAFIIQYYEVLPEYILFIHGHATAWHHPQPITEVINSLAWSYIWSHSHPSQQQQSPFYHSLNTLYYQNTSFLQWLLVANHYINITQGTIHHPSESGYPDGFSFHQAAQFLVHRNTLYLHNKTWWQQLYMWCRYTRLEPAHASRVLEYTWHFLLGQPAREIPKECGKVSYKEDCIRP